MEYLYIFGFHKIKFFILISIYTAVHEGVPTRLHVRRTLHNSVSTQGFVQLLSPVFVLYQYDVPEFSS